MDLKKSKEPDTRRQDYQITPITSLDVHVMLSDLNVEIDVSHTFDGDLDISLTHDAGTTIDLTSNNGGSGDNFVDTVFDDEAGTPIAGLGSGSAPFTGSFQPEGSLSSFDGELLAGTWTLTVFDQLSSDTGTLYEWRIFGTATTHDSCGTVPEPASLAVWSVLGVAVVGGGLRKRRRHV